MSPWPLHGREAGKTNESSCNSAAPEFRPARQKGLQACSQMCSGTWHAKAIFNHGIYFFPSPSTILHLSICVWEGTAGPKSIPGVQGNPERLFRSRLEARKQNWPLGPAAECSYSVPLDSSCLPPKTPKEETCEWRCPAWRPLKCASSLAGPVREGPRNGLKTEIWHFIFPPIFATVCIWEVASFLTLAVLMSIVNGTLCVVCGGSSPIKTPHSIEPLLLCPIRCWHLQMPVPWHPRANSGNSGKLFSPDSISLYPTEGTGQFLIYSASCNPTW